MKRPSWDEYFMQITEIVKERSTCLRRKVGATIVKNKRILTTGYNGPPEGFKHCEDIGGCIRDRMGIASGQRQELSRAVHAEQNAIIQAAKMGISIADSTLYVTNHPCVICTKMLISNMDIKCSLINEYKNREKEDIYYSNNVKVMDKAYNCLLIYNQEV
jgi:dCMP deaminase